jgi:hypothetical protein
MKLVIASPRIPLFDCLRLEELQGDSQLNMNDYKRVILDYFDPGTCPDAHTVGVVTHYPVVTNLLWEKLRDDHQRFSGIAAWRDAGFSRDSGGDARFLSGLYVSGEFFRVLGVRPVAGRVLTGEDDRPGCGQPGAVISYGFWQQEFGGGPALGQKLKLNDKPCFSQWSPWWPVSFRHCVRQT